MAPHWRLAFAAAGILASSALAQQPPTAARATPPVAPSEPNFFRPSDDPALTRFPSPATAPPSIATTQAQSAEEQRREREAAERDMDRALRDHLQAQAAAPVARPMIVSPLEGNAPITSPLDGTAPIISPIGR